MVRISSTHRGRSFGRSDKDQDAFPVDRMIPGTTVAHAPAISEADLARARAIRAEVLGTWPNNETARSRFVGLVSLHDEPKLGELAAALAISFTQIGYSSLVIDANFRSPSLHSIFGCPVQPGLSDALGNLRQAPEAIYPTALHNLTVMPAGDPQHREDELIEGGALVDILGGISRRSSVMVVAMRGGRSLATALAGFDAVVPIVRRGDISVREVNSFVDALKRRAIPLAGFVMMG